LTIYIDVHILPPMEPTPRALFAALANESRLRCLMLLSAQGELCVCELTQALGLSQPHVSRHLAQLREAGLVSDRREGIWVHYRIHSDLPDWVLAVLSQTAIGLADQAPYRQDAAALAQMARRAGAPLCGPYPGAEPPSLSTPQDAADARRP
jgi:ArsR family transcriptional regulator